MNALKGGLSSPVCVHFCCQPRSRGSSTRFGTRSSRTLNPVGAVEERTATEVIELSWRLRRVPNIERGILANGVADADERFLTGYQRMLEVTRVEAMRTAAGSGIRKRSSRSPTRNGMSTSRTGSSRALALKETDEALLARGFIEDAAGR